jgi:hypothetical protein
MWMSDNQLSGAIQSELQGHLRSLVHLLLELDISENQLTGTIPSELIGISSMATFDCSKNLLTGSLDPLFCADNRAWEFLGADGDEVADCKCCTCCFGTTG